MPLKSAIWEFEFMFRGVCNQVLGTRRSAARLFGAALSLALVLLVAPVVHASPVTDLAGRWSGWGTVNMTNGTKERVKCVSTFFIENGESSVRQNLRCASSAYKIDVRSDLNVKGKAITGTWEERNHNNSGQITGRLSGSTFRLAISGPVLNAKMTLNASRCKMNINITPVDFNVERIAIGMRKC
ncbi:MAG: hypothetical protein AAFV45_12530 [Pseudomonadota bacterium]